MTPDELRALGMQVAEQGLVGLNAFEIDQVLDEARRVVWTMRFSSVDLTSVANFLHPSERALRAASLMRNLSVMELERLVFELRFPAWCYVFPDTDFERGLEEGLAANRAAQGESQGPVAPKKKGPPLSVIPGGKLH